MISALFYKKIRDKTVQCQLCPHFCTLKKEREGKCRVRKNIDGKLFSLSYARPVSINIDPISKKPIYHMLQGTETFSIGMAGCNLKCNHCQNWEISQESPEKFITQEVNARDLIRKALKLKCPSISYTYTEPLVSYEFVLDIAKLAKESSLKNIIVSNGFINKEPLIELCKYLDAANIDIKAFNEEFYKKICNARLKPVLESLKTLKENKVHIEITNLIIPGLNDNFREIEEMCKWIKNNLGDVPIHFSRFFPMYKMKDKEPTPLKTLEKAYKIAKRHLSFVHLGNVLIKEKQ